MPSIDVASGCAGIGRRTTRDARLPLALCVLLMGSTAHAATVQVDNLLDSGTGSLRDAIALANAGDDIVFAPGLTGTVHLASRLLMDKSLHVIGYGITLDGGDSVKVINVQNSAQVTLDGLTVQHGRGNLGGGISVSVGGLVMNDCYVHHNLANSGGGGINFALGNLVLNNTRVENNVSVDTGGGLVINPGTGSTARLNNSLIAGNQAGTYGGGIDHFSGTLIISGSRIIGNTINADFGRGGGIHSENGALIVRDSTISSNRAYYAGGINVLRSMPPSEPATLLLERSLVSSNTSINYGGGVTVFSAALTSINSTIAHNISGAYGGGIVGYSSFFNAAATLTNTTVAYNRAADSEGGISMSSSGSLTMKNSLLAGNVAPTDPDLSGPFTSQGYNLVQTRGSSTGYAASDLPNGSNAGLGALSYNGGPTLTLPIGSATLNAVPAANCSAREDQRGYRRPAGNCDIGAFEAEGVVALFADGFDER